MSVTRPIGRDIDSQQTEIRIYIKLRKPALIYFQAACRNIMFRSYFRNRKG